MYEILEYIPVTDTTSTSTVITTEPTSTTTTIESTTTTTTSELSNPFFMQEIQIVIIGFVSGMGILGVIGLILFRRTGK
jgi:hypothetical protein